MACYQSCPTKVDKYDINPADLLFDDMDSGTHGRTFMGKQQVDPIHKKVALKVIKIPQGIGGKKIKLNVQQHKNLVKILYHTPDPTGSQHFIVMDYCENFLSRYVKNTSPSWETKADIILQMCRGLEYLHGKDIGHFNLKPSNILIENGDRGLIVRLTDYAFPLEILRRPIASTDGFANWMAPEQFSDDFDYKLSIDVFTFGHIALALCVSPVQDKLLVFKQLAKQMFDDEKLNPLENFSSEISWTAPDGYEKLLEDMLQYNPEKRPLITECFVRLTALPIEGKKCYDVLQGTIRSQHRVMIETLTPRPIIDEMYAKEVLKFEELECLEKLADNESMTRELLYTLERKKSFDAFHMFLTVLKTRERSAYKLIIKSINEMHRGHK